MAGIVASEATIVLMPYKSMMRALCGMCPLAYEKCRITVPHTTPAPDAMHGDRWGRGRSRWLAALAGSLLGEVGMSR